MPQKGFSAAELSPEKIEELRSLARICRGDIIKMTTIAQSGHPGGSLSSIEMYLTLYTFANITPETANDPRRDKIIISHGHTSPGAYSALGRLGYLDIDDAISHFRQCGSPFEGHVERHVPGIEWSTGNLGQGISAAIGFALAAKARGINNHIYCVMGDGEQQKGQIDEARRFIHKFRLTNITVLVDYNRLQLSGPLHEIMPVEISAEFAANGFKVLEVDGHSFDDLYRALKTANDDHLHPHLILAHTTMGKDISFIENMSEYHGKALTDEQYERAMEELGLEDNIQVHRAKRADVHFDIEHEAASEPVSVVTGEPRTYGVEESTDNRSAFGKALKDLGDLNLHHKDTSPIIVFDCDLLDSTKTGDFAKAHPNFFYQSGIQEHNTAAMAGAASTAGVVSFFADFGVFGVDETYNQHRLSDINNANVKVVCTHCGIDVGEDGKTHQCIDYVGNFASLFNFLVIVPADPNQTDRAVRYAAAHHGNVLIVMGRSKLPVIKNAAGEPLFGGAYQFRAGCLDVMREGDDAVLISMGTTAHKAVAASELLKAKGINVRTLHAPTPVNMDRGEIKGLLSSKSGLVFTYEDHNVRTGLGSMIANIVAEEGLSNRLVKFGMEKYGSSGASKELFKRYGLDEASISEKIAAELSKISK